ncbi:MAG: sigma-70 family RNA polymerase sigma factor [Solirubrobacterales bacterium]
MPAALKGQQQSDEALMLRAQTNDADAFAELYDRHAELAYRVARAICDDSSRAEDAVKEGFLAIWRSRGDYRAGADSFLAWSMRIVMNRAIDSSRRAAAQSDRETLIALLGQLPDHQVEVILLAYYGELSHSEIAARLGLRSATVKGRMRLGLAKLRREMGTTSACD